MEDTNVENYTLQLRISEKKLYIASICGNYCRLFNISPYSVGKEINEVFDHDTSRHYYDVYNHLSEDVCRLYYERYIGNILYNINIRYKSPYIYINAVINKEAIIKQGKKYRPEPKNTDDASQYLIISKRNGNYYIDQNYSDFIYMDRKINISAERIFERMFHYNNCNVLNKCCEGESDISLVDAIYGGDENEYFYMNLTPVSKDSLIIRIKKISGDMYFYFNESNSGKYGSDSLSLKSVASAVYDENCVKTDNNYIYEELIDEKEKIDDIAHEMAEDALKKNDTVYKKVSFGDEIYNFLAIPHTVYKKAVFMAVKSRVTKTRILPEMTAEKLTKKEKMTADLLYQGRTMRYIAGEFGVAEGTVKKTVSNIYKKMNVSSRGEFMNECFMNSIECI